MASTADLPSPAVVGPSVSAQRHLRHTQARHSPAVKTVARRNTGADTDRVCPKLAEPSFG